ncbi:DsbA family protein [Patescibacteria group bacterium]
MKNLYIAILAVFVLTACNGGGFVDETVYNIPSDIDVTYSKGNINAPVKIVEFSDYQCPFCAKFTLETLPELQKDYIETGKVLFIFKDFPLPNHSFAQKASEATYCAGEQNEEKFWSMHVKLFENQQNLTNEDLIKYAEELDLESNALINCLETDKYRDLILRNRQDGLKVDVNATPTIMINSEKLTGHQPYENLAKIIDTQLKGT